MRVVPCQFPAASAAFSDGQLMCAQIFRNIVGYHTPVITDIILVRSVESVSIAINEIQKSEQGEITVMLIPY